MKLTYRYAIAAIVMAFALFLLTPTLLPQSMSVPGTSRINLGLDLKGGVQLTLGVDTDKAVRSALVNSGQWLRQKAGRHPPAQRRRGAGTRPRPVRPARRLPRPRP